MPTYRKARISKRTKDALDRVVTKKLTVYQEHKSVTFFKPEAATGSVEFKGDVLTWNGTNGINQGTADVERIGLKIRFNSLKVTLNIKPLVPGTPEKDKSNGTICRFIIVKDKFWNLKTAPNVGDYLQADGAGRYPFMVPYNYARRHRYKIMKDFTHQMVYTSATTAGPDSVYEFYFKLDTPVEYSATTGRPQDLLNNQFLLLYCTDGVLDTTVNCCEYSWNAQWVYTESAN